jgi:endonuclease/exonuclease/phosphatase family metal-dependent hydrolase
MLKWILSALLIGSFGVVFAKTRFERVSPVAVQNALARFPQTAEELEKFEEQAISELEEGRNRFKAQSADEMDFDHVVLAWHQLIEAFFFKKAILTNFQFSEDLLEKAKLGAEHLHNKLLDICLDEEILGTFLAYAKQALEKPLTPSQSYLLTDFLGTIVEELPQDHLLKKEALELYSELSHQEMQPFTYAKGDLKEKVLPRNKTVTILNWNICCFNWGLSMIFGGVLPWQERISRIALALQNSGADIICLQEVFSSEAAEELYLKLKKSFANFYINIGPRAYGFDILNLGIPSGLFVASKYPLSNPVFHPYSAEQTPKSRGYGFFSAEIMNKNTPLASIITTHLQPGSDAEDLQFRRAQLQAILSNVSDQTPTFVCGDLNIERDSKEYNQEIKPEFINTYNNPQWTCCELKDYWWKWDQNLEKFRASNLEYEWIDYFLRLKDQSYQSIQSIHSRILLVGNLLNPKEALSDHRPLLTTITFKK